MVRKKVARKKVASKKDQVKQLDTSTFSKELEERVGKMITG